MRIIILLLGILMFIPFAYSECVIPETDMALEEDTFFCAGTYDVSNLHIVNDNITVDCNGAKLNGLTEGFGLVAKGRDGIVIKNCILRRYNLAVKVQNSEVMLLKNNFSDNSVGLSLLSSGRSVFEDNTFENNLKDYVIRESVQDSDPENLTDFKNKSISLIQNDTDELVNKISVDSVIAKLNLSPDRLESSKDAVDYTLNRMDLNGSTGFTIDIHAKKNIKELRIIQYFPDDVNLVDLGSDFKKTEIRNAYVHTVGDINLGQKLSKSYHVEHTHDIDNPHTLFDAIFKQHDPFLPWAFAFFILEYVYFITHVKSNIRKYKKALSHLDPYKDYLIFKKAYHKLIHSVLGIYLIYNAIERIVLPVIFMIGPRIITIVIDSMFLIYLIIISVEIKRIQEHKVKGAL